LSGVLTSYPDSSFAIFKLEGTLHVFVAYVDYNYCSVSDQADSQSTPRDNIFLDAEGNPVGPGNAGTLCSRSSCKVLINPGKDATSL